MVNVLLGGLNTNALSGSFICIRCKNMFVFVNSLRDEPAVGNLKAQLTKHSLVLIEHDNQFNTWFACFVFIPSFTFQLTSVKQHCYKQIYRLVVNVKEH